MVFGLVVAASGLAIGAAGRATWVTMEFGLVWVDCWLVVVATAAAVSRHHWRRPLSGTG